jgi:hypothetical protein
MKLASKVVKIDPKIIVLLPKNLRSKFLKLTVQSQRHDSYSEGKSCPKKYAGNKKDLEIEIRTDGHLLADATILEKMLTEMCPKKAFPFMTSSVETIATAFG